MMPVMCRGALATACRVLACALVLVGSSTMAARAAGAAATAGMSARELVAHGTAITVRVQTGEACVVAAAGAPTGEVDGDGGDASAAAARESGTAAGDMKDLLRRLGARRPPPQASASGTLLGTDGDIVSAVLDPGCDRYDVTFADGVRAEARLVAIDGEGGIALLRAAPNGRPRGRLAPAGSLQPGDTVVAFGYVHASTLHVGRGIVGSTTRLLPELGGGYRGEFIQSDADIRRGAAGGPLLDLQGNVVGVHLAILSTTGAFEGVSYALPASFVQRALDDLRQHGRVRRGALGATFQDGLDDAGRPTVTTTALTPGLPAAAALQVGDRVLAVDGVAVATMDAVAARVQMRLPGDTVVLRLVRAGVTQEVALVLGDLADMETEE